MAKRKKASSGLSWMPLDADMVGWRHFKETL